MTGSGRQHHSCCGLLYIIYKPTQPCHARRSDPPTPWLPPRREHYKSGVIYNYMRCGVPKHLGPGSHSWRGLGACNKPHAGLHCKPGCRLACLGGPALSSMAPLHQGTIRPIPPSHPPQSPPVTHSRPPTRAPNLPPGCAASGGGGLLRMHGWGKGACNTAQ